MEQKVNETKNVEGQNFSTEWYEKQNPTNKDGNELNGFTSILLWLSMMTCGTSLYFSNNSFPSLYFKAFSS